MKLNYYISPTGNAYENLAMDEYFLTHLPPDTHLLYFYINDNAVIIGRNQNAFRECDLDALKERNVKLVRRLTGGGAVYHDVGNLNFSFISPEGMYDTDRQDEILLSALRSLGIEAEKNGRNDFVADGRKFSGNAFGAKGGNRVRHGTLLISSDMGKLDKYLTVSAKKLRAKGVASVRSRVCNLTEFCPTLTPKKATEAILKAFEAHYGMEASPLTLSASDEDAIGALAVERSSFDWVMGEAPTFDYSFEERFSFGMLQLCLTVTDGKVSRAEIFTDSLDITLPDRVKAVLKGEAFTPENIGNALFRTQSAELGEIGRYIINNI
ncbi:MAG: lipoate--protein ligase [Ruminococcaceae bacterium]|nr:lipoate--protein ligase [Oscillospiraceae bacterium]